MDNRIDQREQSQCAFYIENPYAKMTGYSLKGNLHTHSLPSGGSAKSSPLEVSSLYAEQGYDFISVTDHDLLTLMSPETDIICIPGEELSTPLPRGHMLALNIEVPIDLSLTDQERIDAIRSQGGFAVLAHPNIHTEAPSTDPFQSPDNGWSDETIAALRGFTGVEVFNYITELYYPSGYAVNRWDSALSRGQRCWGFASDDAHILEAHGANSGRRNPQGWLGGWIVVWASRRAGPDICEAVLRGRFYASTGIDIRTIELKDNDLRIETANATALEFIGNGGNTLHVISGHSGSYHMRGHEVYVRVTCHGEGKQRAWTQPLFVNRPNAT